MKNWIITGIILGSVVLIGGVVISSYNTIPGKDEAVKAAWSEVLNQYQRRADLTTNLVNTVQGYADHESKTLIGVIHERASATKMEVSASSLNDPNAISKLEQNQQTLATTLGRLLVSVERYPELKANLGFLKLQKDLKETENMILGARRRYITVSQQFNRYIRTIPGKWWNDGFYMLPPVAQLSVSTEKQEVPTVNFRK